MLYCSQKYYIKRYLPVQASLWYFFTFTVAFNSFSIVIFSQVWVQLALGPLARHWFESRLSSSAKCRISRCCHSQLLYWPQFGLISVSLSGRQCGSAGTIVCMCGRVWGCAYATAIFIRFAIFSGFLFAMLHHLPPLHANHHLPHRAYLFCTSCLRIKLTPNFFGVSQCTTTHTHWNLHIHTYAASWFPRSCGCCFCNCCCLCCCCCCSCCYWLCVMSVTLFIVRFSKLSFFAKNIKK